MGTRSLNLDTMPSVGFMNSVFGQPMPSGVLDQFHHGGSINLNSFPSLPVGSSLDFDHYMQQHGGQDHILTSAPHHMAPSPFQSMSRIGSLGQMGKLESMELPDTVAHMLHEIPPDQRDQAGLQQANSGLESMQSIEQALGNVDDSGLEKLSEDYWMTAAHGSATPPKIKASNSD